LWICIKEKKIITEIRTAKNIGQN